MRPSAFLERPRQTSAETAPGADRFELCMGRPGSLTGLASPPAVSEPIASGARISGAWRFGPFDSHLPGPADHVLVTTLSAEGRAAWKTPVQTLHASLTRGAFTLVPRGHDGHWRVMGAGMCRGVLLDPARLQRCAEEVGRGREVELLERLQAPDPAMFSIMRLLGEEVGAGATDRALLLEQLVDLLCLHLLRRHACVTARLERPTRGGLAPWQTHRIIAYMKERLDQDISLQDLADVVRLSRFHFCSAFRLATGSTPHETLTRLRLDEACRLLASSNRPVSEVALSVGFQTPSAFAARFRKVVGLTPREFRRSRGFFTARSIPDMSEPRSIPVPA